MVLAVSDGISLTPSYSGYSLGNATISLTGRSPSMVCRSRQFSYNDIFHIASPTTPVVYDQPVWAVPVSLATTQGITIVFSSSAYLDVSVQRVCLMHLCIQCMICRYDPTWVFPFGDLRIKGCFRLPEAYRR